MLLVHVYGRERGTSSFLSSPLMSTTTIAASTLSPLNSILLLLLQLRTTFAAAIHTRTTTHYKKVVFSFSEEKLEHKFDGPNKLFCESSPAGTVELAVCPSVRTMFVS